MRKSKIAQKIFDGHVINYTIAHKLNSTYMNISKISCKCAALSLATSTTEYAKNLNFHQASQMFEHLTTYPNEMFQQCLQILDGYSILTTRGYNIPLTCQYDDDNFCLSYRGRRYDDGEIAQPGYWVLSMLDAVREQYGDFVCCYHTGHGFTYEQKIKSNMTHNISLTEVLRELE